jgi:hypothetical protein
MKLRVSALPLDRMEEGTEFTVVNSGSREKFDPD